MQFQYQVPQFIDTEDKIIGPLTLKQFFIIAAGLGIVGVSFMVLRLSFAIMISIPVLALSFSLALVRVYGMPLWRYFGALFNYVIRPQEYFWKK